MRRRVRRARAIPRRRGGGGDDRGERDAGAQSGTFDQAIGPVDRERHAPQVRGGHVRQTRQQVDVERHERAAHERRRRRPGPSPHDQPSAEGSHGEAGDGHQVELEHRRPTQEPDRRADERWNDQRIGIRERVTLGREDVAVEEMDGIGDERMVDPARASTC